MKISTFKARIISNLTWSLVAEVGTKLIFFLVTVYLARKLGIESYGIFVFAQTIISYFWFAVDLGISMYGSREISKDKKNSIGIINSLLTLRITSGLIIFFILFITIQMFIANDLKKTVMIGCSFYLISRAINIDWVLRGFEKFKYIAIGNIATFFPMMLLVLILIRDKEDVVIASYMWSLCYLIGGIVLLFILYNNLNVKYIPDFKIDNWMKHLKESVHFSISGGLSMLYYSLPIFFIGTFATDYELGIFSAPFKLVFSIIFIYSMISMSLYPIFSELFENNINKFYKLQYLYIKASVISGIILNLMISIYSKELIIVIYGITYSNSYISFSILTWFTFLLSMRVVYNTIISAAGLQRYNTLVNFFSIIFFSLTFFFLSSFTNISYPVVASCSLVITEAGVVFLMIIICKKKIEIHLNKVN